MRILIVLLLSITVLILVPRAGAIAIMNEMAFYIQTISAGDSIHEVTKLLTRDSGYLFSVEPSKVGIKNVGTNMAGRGAIIKGTGDDRKFKKYLLPLNGVHHLKWSYVIYDITASCAGGVPSLALTYKIRYFGCKETADTFYTTKVATKSALYHDGDTFVKYADTESTYSDSSYFIKSFNGEDSSGCGR